MRLSLSMLFTLLAFACASVPAQAQQSGFDLVGPTLVATVTRDGTTLPLGQVPSLRAGDKLSIAADLPTTQSAEYRLVIAFLRGPTNPPGKDWFAEAETWKKKDNTLEVEVPEGAEQVVVFMAPETSGGFDAIRKTVRGRPGVFVRAAQDLYQASLDRARLESFVAGVSRIEAQSPDRLSAVSPVLAEALGIKLNADCLTRQRALRAACLTQQREDMILQTSNGKSLTETLTGAPVDLAYRIAATPQGGAGYYSPYIGLARDVARLFGAFRTAQYQYVPALALGSDDRLRLRLNAAPSFQNPRSVIVVPMPPLGEAPTPVWRPAMKAGLCVSRPGAAIPLEGAQLLYATGYARDLHVRLTTDDGKTTVVPVTPDPERGGVVLGGAAGAVPSRPITAAVLGGKWGFTPFTGPALPAQNGPVSAWQPQPGPEVVVGRDHPLLLRGGAAACVQQIAMKGRDDSITTLPWKQTANDEIEVTLPLTRTKPSTLSLLVAQYGDDKPATIELTARTEPSRIDGFVVHSGEDSGVLTGARLDQVAALTVGDLRFEPDGLTRTAEGDRLAMKAATALVQDAGAAPAKVLQRDGRSLSLNATVAAARPTLTLVSRSVSAPKAAGLALTLPDGTIPADGTLTFSVRTSGAAQADDALEVEAVDGNARTKLTVQSGAVQRVGDDVAIASIQPRQALGSAVTGGLRVRLVRGDGASDWKELARVVRLPTLTAVECKEAQSCAVPGQNLFLIAAVGATGDRARAQPVPDGFVGASLTAPHPADGALYLWLHDAPAMPIRVAVK